MSRIYKLLGDPDSYRHLWENREALEKYLQRLKELMEQEDENDNGVKMQCFILKEQSEDQSTKHS